jgi:hypothetical protein
MKTNIKDQIWKEVESDAWKLSLEKVVWGQVEGQVERQVRGQVRNEIYQDLHQEIIK